MVYGFVEKSKKKPTWHEMLHAIKRNFGGLDQVDPVESFKKHLATVVHFETKVRYKFCPFVATLVHIVCC